MTLSLSQRKGSMNTDKLETMINSIIDKIEVDIEDQTLDQKTSERLIEYLKALVLVSRDNRVASKEKVMDTSSIIDLDAAIAKEIKDLQGKGVL